MNEEFINYDESVDVSPVDMIFYLLMRWKLLVVWLIIGAIIGFGAYALKLRQAKSTAANAVATTVDDYEIDDDALSKMETASKYRQEWESYATYMEESIYIQLDANNFYVGTLRYNYTGTGDTNVCWSNMDNTLNDEELLAALRDAGGFDCELSYIREIVNPTGSSAGLYKSYETAEDSTVKLYVIFAPDQESCQAMLDVLEETLTAVAKKNGITFLDSSINASTNTTLSERQSTIIGFLNSYLTNIQTLEDKLTDEEYQYYQVKFLGEEEEESDVAVSYPSKVKWLAIGIFAGIVIWGIWCILVYVTDRSVKTIGELKNHYMLNVIGCVNPGKVRGFAKLYARFKNEPDEVPYIVSMIDTLGISETAICGHSLTENEEAIIAAIKKDVPKLQVVDYISQDMAALKSVKAAGAEIIVVRLRSTTRGALLRELQVCNMQGIRVAGILVMD